MARTEVDDPSKWQGTVVGELIEIAIMRHYHSSHRCCSVEQDMIWFPGPAGLVDIKDIEARVAQKCNHISVDVLIREELKIT